MKFYNPSPVLLAIGSENITSYHSSLGMLAITPRNELKIVREIKQFPLWRNYWEQIRAGKLSNEIYWDEDPIDLGITQLGEEIIYGLRYIMAKGYIFIGFCYIDGNIFDRQYLAAGLFAKRKNKHFINMHLNYRENGKYPTIVQNNAIEASFIGQGEKFFTLERFNFQQIIQMSDFFRGSFSGVVGLNLDQNASQFVILSQNITSDAEITPMVFDKKGRDTIRTLISSDHFSPAGGFKIDYGIWALGNLPFWSSLDLLPHFTKEIQTYFEYLKSLVKKQEPSYPKNPRVNILDKIIEIPKPPAQKTTLSTEEMLSSSEELKTVIPPKQPDVKLQEITVENPILSQPTPTKPQEVHTQIIKPSLPKPTLPKPELSKPALPLEKIGIDSFDVSSSETSPTEAEDYEDVFEQEPEELFDANGKSVLDPTKIDEKFLSTASSTLEKDFGLAIDLNLMTEEDVFKDLEASLAAMSKLDELASKDSAISRIYYPPPSLIAFANKEGMKIGGSTAVLSMGTGRNIWMVPELRRLEMWGKFYKEKDLADQIEDFVALPEKDIESKEELDSTIQKAFINIRKNNHIYLGVGEIEGNGFERNVFEECKLDNDNLRKLTDIFSERRQTVEFPELTSESFIEVRYFGNPTAISFFAKPDSQGILEIAEDFYNTPVSNKGILSGVVCTDFDAVYFYILTDNLAELEQENPSYIIDQATLDRMYSMIKHDKLTPVSWFKVMCGFHGLELLPQWEEINDEVIFPIVQDQYEYYMKNLLNLKSNEDEIRKKIEDEFPKE